MDEHSISASLHSLHPSPSSPKRFIGYDPENKELDADRLRECLYGGHVANYMRYLMEEDEEKYKAHFSRFIKNGITPDNVREAGREVGVA